MVMGNIPNHQNQVKLWTDTEAARSTTSVNLFKQFPAWQEKHRLLPTLSADEEATWYRAASLNNKRPDFRVLNSRIVRKIIALPLMRDIFQILDNSKSEILSCVDLKDAYHSIKLRKRQTK